MVTLSAKTFCGIVRVNVGILTVDCQKNLPLVLLLKPNCENQRNFKACRTSKTVISSVNNVMAKEI